MEVVALLLFIGAVWVLFALGLFAWSLLQKNHEHADRLALLPLEDNWHDRAAGALDALPGHDTKERKAPVP